MAHKLLKIDGDYFANRVIGYLNMGDSVNNLTSKNEIDSFRGALNQSLVSVYTTFQPFIDNLIFVKDNKSWRKEIEPIKPYYVVDNRVLGYKEQRVEKKEESPIDYTVFREIYAEFVDSIKSLIPVFDIKGLEGDDNLMLLSNYHANKDIESYVFCTDGDLMQVVKDNCLLMRNIKSKNSPSGDFVLTFKKYCELFERDAKQQLLKSVDTNFYNRLFQISISGNQKVLRKLNEGLDIATPYKVALVKSICGDKKDNLFSIMSWKSSTGTIDYKLTEKIIEKSLKKQGLMLTESTCKAILSDKNQLINLIHALQKDVQPNMTQDVFKTVLNHLFHNLKLNVLTPTNIPEEYVKNFDIAYKLQENQFMSKINYIEVFKSLQVTKKDSATNIFESSIPDILI